MSLYGSSRSRGPEHVVPAHAGTQRRWLVFAERHWVPAFARTTVVAERHWVPAFARTTAVLVSGCRAVAARIGAAVQHSIFRIDDDAVRMAGQFVPRAPAIERVA